MNNLPDRVIVPPFQNGKPHMKLDKIGDCWLCKGDDPFMHGRARTFRQAFENYTKAVNRLTSIPRSGWWNKKDARKWYHEGCPRKNTYIGHKLIVGYDFDNDFLILRG